MLRYALSGYHTNLKRVLDAALADPDIVSKISKLDSKGRLQCNKFLTSKFLYTLAPKEWALAPLRDYLVGDAGAMLMSHFAKLQKGANLSNPPTVRRLEAPTATEISSATDDFSHSIQFPIKPRQDEKIHEAAQDGRTRVAGRLTNIYKSWAATRAAGEMLRSLETPLPRPIEFTRPEFSRGFLLAKSGGKFYLLVRLFAKSSRYRKPLLLKEDFVDLRTGAVIGGRQYPGLVFPLELGREHHENEFLRYGRPQSAKLIMKTTGDGRAEFYVHVAFEFDPPKIEPQTFIGIDRGAAMIGAATIIGRDGRILEQSNLQGRAFSREMARDRARIAEAQRKGQMNKKKRRLFRVRGKKAQIVIGEYANLLIRKALDRKSQVFLEKIDARSMARFLTQSQFRKLHSALEYKAARQGLPAPIEVPAARTSQTCPRCANWDPANRPKTDAAGNSIQDVFRCTKCGLEANADENASYVIALRGLHQTLNGGKFQKFAEFQKWLGSFSGRDSLPVQSQASP